MDPKRLKVTVEHFVGKGKVVSSILTGSTKVPVNSLTSDGALRCDSVSETSRALTIADVAAEYDVTASSVYSWIKSRDLAAIRLPGGDYRFRQDHLKGFVPPKRTAQRVYHARLSRNQKIAKVAAAKAAEIPDAKGFVYFIQSGGKLGPIKIGTATNVARRLRGLQTAHYETLRVLGSIAGNSVAEHELHRHFKEDHINGEWHRPSRRLLKFIEEIVV